MFVRGEAETRVFITGTRGVARVPYVHTGSGECSQQAQGKRHVLAIGRKGEARAYSGYKGRGV